MRLLSWLPVWTLPTSASGLELLGFSERCSCPGTRCSSLHPAVRSMVPFMHPLRFPGISVRKTRQILSSQAVPPVALSSRCLVQILGGLLIHSIPSPAHCWVPPCSTGFTTASTLVTRRPFYPISSLFHRATGVFSWTTAQVCHYCAQISLAASILFRAKGRYQLTPLTCLSALGDSLTSPSRWLPFWTATQASPTCGSLTFDSRGLLSILLCLYARLTLAVPAHLVLNRQPSPHGYSSLGPFPCDSPP